MPPRVRENFLTRKRGFAARKNSLAALENVNLRAHYIQAMLLMNTTDDAEDSQEANSPRPEWDDAAFVRQVTEAAEARGMTVSDVMRAAGVARDYLNKAPMLGRNIGQVLKIARFLGIDPVVLMGLGSDKSGDQPAIHGIKLTPRQIDRLTMVASIAAQLKVALDPRPEMAEEDSRRLIDVVLRAVADAA